MQEELRLNEYGDERTPEKIFKERMKDFLIDLEMHFHGALKNFTTIFKQVEQLPETSEKPDQKNNCHEQLNNDHHAFSAPIWALMWEMENKKPILDQLPDESKGDELYPLLAEQEEILENQMVHCKRLVNYVCSALGLASILGGMVMAISATALCCKIFAFFAGVALAGAIVFKLAPTIQEVRTQPLSRKEKHILRINKKYKELSANLIEVYHQHKPS